MTLSTRQPKPKKCRICRETFTPVKSLQAVCGPKCALETVTRRRDRERKSIEQRERRELRASKERIKPRSEHLREAQAAFNAYIRLRDRLAGHPCISSGRQLDWNGNDVDAGHYRSVGAAPHLRFDERNCHAQSKKENRYLSGNAADYRIGLIQRIGLEAVEALESDNTTRKYSIEDLKQIKAKYRALVRELKGRAA